MRSATPPAVSLMLVTSGTPNGPPVNATDLNAFATKYTAAWCSQNAASVASFFAEHGSLTINGGSPAVGGTAITASAQGFMTAFPDLIVAMDSLTHDRGRIGYHWTLSGMNTGPGGTGNHVRVSGYESWTFGSDGLIASSLGYYDEADYRRQLNGPAPRAP